MQSIAKLTFVTYDDKIVNFAPLCSPCKGNWYVYSYSTVAFFTANKGKISQEKSIMYDFFEVMQTKHP